MTAAARIRQHVIERYIEPARASGAAEVSIRLGDVPQQAQLSIPLEWVWSALDTKHFRDEAGVERPAHVPPRVHANTRITFRLILLEPKMQPLREVFTLPVDELALDHRNPRLAGAHDDTSDEGIIAHLYRSDELSELLQSIAANGYLDIEPLIVVRENDRLIVLEGNRRLAAIRLFREEDLVERVTERGRIRIALPDFPEPYRASLDRVSVYQVEDREDARSFIGFKHINGAAKWTSYAKAKFAANWYRDEGVSLAGIAGRIGDKHDTIKRMVNAIYVLEQAQGAGAFDIEDRMVPRFNFSHLYTALSRGPYMEFLGLGGAWATYKPCPDPVPEERMDRLSEVLKWLYGSKEDDAKPVVESQNPHIKQLGEVLTSAEGLNVLRVEKSLPAAYASIQPAESRFSEALLKARENLRDASNSLRGFDGRDASLLDIAEDVREAAQTMYDRMKKKVFTAAAGEE